MTVPFPENPPTDEEVEAEMARSLPLTPPPLDVRLSNVESDVAALDQIIVAVLS